MKQFILVLSKLDFNSGQKTITGVAIYLLPVVTASLGVDLSAGEVTQLISNWFEIFGAALALYGLAVKGIRGTMDLIIKFR